MVLKRRYQTSIKTIENEKNVLGLEHPNIINILNVINDNNLVGLIIMEKITGMSLQEKLDDDPFQLNTSQRLGFALDISLGIEFCHSQRILHLDIKPYNILVCFVTNTCKLCDFGSSERIVRGKIIEAHLNTVVYTAPEVLQGKAPTYASDIYSLGVTLWQLQSRKHPYNGLDQEFIIDKVCRSRLRPESAPPTDAYKKLYNRCWSQDPNFRPHIKCVIKQLTKLKSSR